jgi:cytochrome c-type biogenesis protein CcmH/NrfG
VDRTDVVAHYRTAARLRPEVAETHYRLARLLAADPLTRPEAHAEVVKALALNPAFPDAQALLGQLDAAEE